MITLSDITKPVESYVNRFHEIFREILSSKSEWLTLAFEHLEKSSGKRIRPVLVTLIASIFNPKLSDKTVESAVFLELIHTATLIHDDVIDEARTRRGQPALNAIFDNRIAVLMGDYIFSSALIGAIAYRDMRIVSIVSRMGRELTEGEIMQMETADRVVLDENVYLDVIRQKTAILFRSCAEIGCITNDVSAEDSAVMGKVGELIGLIFQIKDDIFDYFPNDVGKPTGNDIPEGKITLPLLYALKNANPADSERLMSIINTKNYTQENLRQLTEFAINNGGVSYAETRMQQYANEVKTLLLRFPDSVYRQSLFLLVDYVMERKI